MKLHVLGIDLGKTVFHLVGVDSTGKSGNSQEMFPQAVAGLHREFAGAVDWHGVL